MIYLLKMVIYIAMLVYQDHFVISPLFRYPRLASMWWIVGCVENGWVLVEGLMEVLVGKGLGPGGTSAFYDVHMDRRFMEDMEDSWIMDHGSFSLKPYEDRQYE